MDIAKFMDKHGVVIMLLIGVIIVLFVPFIEERATLPGDLAQIEQLRKDSVDMQCSIGEDIAGQITQWNQAIVRNRANNQLWYRAWLVPDEWDKVELIALPECNQ